VDYDELAIGCKLHVNLQRLGALVEGPVASGNRVFGRPAASATVRNDGAGAGSE
jgi:hypothetical protein